MNKLIMIPLTLLILICTMSILMGYTIQDNTVDINNTGHSDTRHVWNLWGLIQTDSGDDGTNTLIFTAIGILALLVTAIAIGSASGLNILGSGMSTYTQKLVFIGIFYLPLWGGLSIGASNLLLNNGFLGIGAIFWIILTFCFAVGLAIDATHVYGAD